MLRNCFLKNLCPRATVIVVYGASGGLMKFYDRATFIAFLAIAGMAWANIVYGVEEANDFCNQLAAPASLRVVLLTVTVVGFGSIPWLVLTGFGWLIPMESQPQGTRPKPLLRLIPGEGAGPSEKRGQLALVRNQHSSQVPPE